MEDKRWDSFTFVLIEIGCTLLVWFFTLAGWAATYGVVLYLSRISVHLKNGDAQLVVVGTVAAITWVFQASLMVLVIKWIVVGDSRRSVETKTRLPEGGYVCWLMRG